MRQLKVLKNLVVLLLIANLLFFVWWQFSSSLYSSLTNNEFTQQAPELTHQVNAHTVQPIVEQ